MQSSLKRVFAVVVALGFASPGAAQNVVNHWNERAVQAAVVKAGKPPCAASIYLAIVQLAVYDAVNAIDGRYEPYGPALDAPYGASQEAAAVSAAYHTLVELFPAQASDLDAEYAASLSGIPDDPSRQAGIEVGQQAAASILALREDDGREADVPYVAGSGPGAWIPTAPGQIAQTPWVGEVQPFTMKRPGQFLPKRPPKLSHQQWALEYDEVKQIGAVGSTLRTAEQTEIGLFWTASPIPQATAAHRTLVEEQGLDTADSARLLAMVSAAGADGCIGCFNAKYHYGFWRPVTAIRAGDTDGNPDTVPDPDWTPLAVTPNHPEYPSAHGCFTGAGTAVMAGFFGSEEVSTTWKSSVTNSTHVFARFSDVIDEVGVARIYAGIHYRAAVDAGTELGHRVAKQLLKKFFRPVDDDEDEDEEDDD